MRPPGEVRQALLLAAHEWATPERGATLREMASHAQVGLDAAAHTVQNMRRAGVLQQARLRRVDYRNKPVAEYVPAPAVAAEAHAYRVTPGERLRSFWERRPEPADDVDALGNAPREADSI
jgi:hypothetical protein